MQSISHSTSSLSTTSQSSGTSHTRIRDIVPAPQVAFASASLHCEYCDHGP